MTKSFAALCFVLIPAALVAQDTRTVTEPRFPPVCAVVHATLSSSTQNGPDVPADIDSQDSESAAETGRIQNALDACRPGHAVELALGKNLAHNAFLVNPLSVPPRTSLIIDGGVTVFASRDPENYNYTPTQTTKCGTITNALFGGICKAVVTFNGDSSGKAESGLYGYGVLDGQGQQDMLTSDSNATPTSWWALIGQKHGNVALNENSPLMVSAGDTTGASLAGNFTIYKVTVRNPPYHTINWGGDGLTVWGVRVQAPWTVGNTDGFDLHGVNGTIYDTIVSNGDDDVAFPTNKGPTANFTVRRFSMYGRDGLTVLGNSETSVIKNILMEDITMTGDLPSVVGTTVNGITEPCLMKQFGLKSYAQALPSSTESLHALNIKYTSEVTKAEPVTGGASITGVTFRNVCIQDIQKPINIQPQAALGQGETPTVTGITFDNVHILAPTEQAVLWNHNKNPAISKANYAVTFQGGPAGSNFTPQFTLKNVVFDDLEEDAGTSLFTLDAVGNDITTRRNAYPAILDKMDQTGTNLKFGNTTASLGDNVYNGRTATSSPLPANSCSTALPFITGELYASLGSPLATGSETNLSELFTWVGDTIALNAVLQPIMSQTTYYGAGVYDSDPGLAAIGSPAMSNAVRFYDGDRFLGSASLSANGTLASLTIKRLSPGFHIFSAEYPKDDYYATLHFGVVVVFTL